MTLDLYTLAAFFAGILAGAVLGYWLARFITGLTVERLERKVLSLSENKFELQGQRVRLKQLEQRLDAEAASIPHAERELKDKSGEIRELTAALNETTALTSELTNALRARKAKVQQLQVEQTKWLKRNKALLLKSESTEKAISGLQKDIATNRRANEALEARANGTHINGTQKAANGTANGDKKHTNGSAAPALAAAHHNGAAANESDVANGHVDRLVSRMQEMESELQGWFDRVGKLEQNVTGQVSQANGLALLEEVLRGEAEKQNSVATDDAPKALGSRNGA